MSKFIALRQDGAVYIISQEEAEEAENNTGSDWHSWQEYYGDLPIGAKVSGGEAKQIRKST